MKSYMEWKHVRVVMNLDETGGVQYELWQDGEQRPVPALEAQKHMKAGKAIEIKLHNWVRSITADEPNLQQSRID